MCIVVGVGWVVEVRVGVSLSTSWSRG